MAATTAEERIRKIFRSPDEATLSEIRAQQWTGHNIPLTDADSTLGRQTSLIGDDPRTVTIKALIRRFLGDRGPLRVLDLGSLEGGVTFEMAREGWDATGIEGRESNFQKAELIRRYFGLENLQFQLRDVKTLDPARDGRFDAVLCCGLLYHLDDPFDFLRRLRAITADDGLLFLDTHVAPEAGAALHDTYAQHLSGTTTFHDAGRDYDGRWFAEPQQGSVLDQQWSAVSNARSFWPSRRSLIRAVYHAGFPAVMELFGMFDIDGEFALRDQFSRLWIAAVRRL